ncbi:MAG: hypothetical protein E2O39_12615, partial [Planctomycetota bacterium]
MRWKFLVALALPLALQSGACEEPNIDPTASSRPSIRVTREVQPRSAATEVELEGPPAEPPIERELATVDPALPVFVHGRLVDARGGRLPEGGILVRLKWGESKAEVRTGPDGRFRFELAEPARSGRLSVILPRSWRWRRP